MLWDTTQLLAAAFAYESDHHALRNVGQGHVVLEEGGEEEWSARSRGNSWRSFEKLCAGERGGFRALPDQCGSMPGPIRPFVHN